MDAQLRLWNYCFHDGVIELMQGRIPGDIRLTIKPGLGNRKYFPDPGDRFIVVMRKCSTCELTKEGAAQPEVVIDLDSVWDVPSLFGVERDGDAMLFDCVLGVLRMRCGDIDVFLDSGTPVSYEELNESCDRWWNEWRKYWNKT